MINVSKSAIKEIAKTSKDLALDLKKHEYDEEKMKMAQRQMFVVLQIGIFLNAMVYGGYNIASNLFIKAQDDPSNYYR